jgi:ABC-type methionine transport system ATPase subunit
VVGVCEDALVTSIRLHLTFPEHLISEPVLHHVASEFELVTNIRRANLEEDRGGWVIVELSGDGDAIARAIAWLDEQGLQVDRIDA